NLAGEDVREGLTAVISVKLHDPQFEGQTKTKLGNPPIKSLVEETVNRKLAEWLDENPPDASRGIFKAIHAAPPPAARRSRRAPAAPRRPCHCAERSSTSRRAGSTKSSPTTRCRR